MVIVVSRWARRTTCRSRSRQPTATPSRWPSAQRRCWPSAVPPPPRKSVARLCILIGPLVWLWAGTTPYSLTWTQSGNVNRNATHFSLVNMLGNVVSVNATTVLSAVASQTNSTNGLYLLCTRLPLSLSRQSSRGVKSVVSHKPIDGSDGRGQLADSGELAVPAASLVDGGLPEVYRAGGLDLLGLDFAPGLPLGRQDRRRVVGPGARDPEETTAQPFQRALRASRCDFCSFILDCSGFLLCLGDV